MKVVCETCEAKYQIPDERVAGRRLRIRCRKCGGVMEARGDELLAAMPAQPGPTEWFTSIDGSPIGPLSTDDIVSRIATGVLDWDAHVWREGYAEWVTVDASDTLVRAVASSRGAVADEPRADSTERTSLPPHETAERDDYERTVNEDAPTIAALEDSPTRVAYDETPTRMYSSQSAPPGVLPPVARASFASRPPGTLQPIARPSFGESSPNAFAASGNGNGHGNGGAYASAAPSHYSSPAIDVSRAQLTGGPMPLPSAMRAPQSAPPVRAGFAGGEGSGLIDIRALASLAQTRMNTTQRGITPQVAPQVVTTSIDVDDDEAAESDPLASFGTGHGVAFAALDSLAPAANREKSEDRTVPYAIVTGAAMIAAATFAALYLTRAPSLAPSPMATAAQPTAELAAPEPAPAPAAEPAAPGAAAPAAEPDAPAQAAAPQPQAAAEPAADEDEAEQASKVAVAPKAARVGGKRVVRKAAAGAAGADKAEAKDEDEAEDEDDLLETAEAKPEKAPPPTVDDILLADDKPAEKAEKKEPEAAKPAKAQSESRSIDDLLDVAVAKKSAAPPPSAPAAGGASAESPSRADVLAAMKKIEGEVRACAANEATPLTGTANVAITVAGSTGKVTGAEVTGITGAVGSCIARVARTATFAPFTKDRFSVTFPYRFK